MSLFRGMEIKSFPDREGILFQQFFQKTYCNKCEGTFKTSTLLEKKNVLTEFPRVISVQIEHEEGNFSAIRNHTPLEFMHLVC